MWWDLLAGFFIVEGYKKARAPLTDGQRANNKRFVLFLIKWLFVPMAILFILQGFVFAQTINRTYQDSMGRNVGRSSTDVRGNTTFYNERGQNTGRSSTQNGTTTIYNERGQQTGTIRSNR